MENLTVMRAKQLFMAHTPHYPWFSNRSSADEVGTDESMSGRNDRNHMKVIEHTAYQTIPLPDGTIKRIAIPRLEIIPDHVSTSHPHQEKPPTINHQMKIILAIGLLGLAGFCIANHTPTNPQCNMSHNFPEAVQQWEPNIESACQKTGVPSNLLGALIEVESAGNQWAISSSQACGLTQVVSNNNMMTNPQGERYFADRPSCEALITNPQFAIDTGAEMLQNFYSQTNNWKDTLILYGPSDVSDWYAEQVLQTKTEVETTPKK